MSLKKVIRRQSKHYQYRYYKAIAVKEIIYLIKIVKFPEAQNGELIFINPTAKNTIICKNEYT